jgi:hypothetical protein
MTAFSIVCGTVAVGFIVVGFAMLARAGVQIYRHVRLGQSDPFRAGPVVPRAEDVGEGVPGAYPDVEVGCRRGRALWGTAMSKQATTNSARI